MVTLTTIDMTEGYPGLTVGDVGEQSILEIMQRVCKVVGLDEPDVAVANTDETYKKLLNFSVETIEELIRRVDWPILSDTFTITGTGANDTYDMAVGFDHLAKGNAVTIAGEAIRGTVSQSEWQSLTAVSGTPRYFRLRGNFIEFWPYPTDVMTVTIAYQSKLWCSNGTNAWAADTDTPLIPSELVIKGMVWRFKRYIGNAFDDYFSEYEAAIADHASFDGRVRR